MKYFINNIFLIIIILSRVIFNVIGICLFIDNAGNQQLLYKLTILIHKYSENTINLGKPITMEEQSINKSVIPIKQSLENSASLLQKPIKETMKSYPLIDQNVFIEQYNLLQKNIAKDINELKKEYPGIIEADDFSKIPDEALKKYKQNADKAASLHIRIVQCLQNNLQKMKESFWRLKNKRQSYQDWKQFQYMSFLLQKNIERFQIKSKLINLSRDSLFQYKKKYELKVQFGSLGRFQSAIILYASQSFRLGIDEQLKKNCLNKQTKTKRRKKFLKILKDKIGLIDISSAQIFKQNQEMKIQGWIKGEFTNKEEMVNMEEEIAYREEEIAYREEEIAYKKEQIAYREEEEEIIVQKKMLAQEAQEQMVQEAQQEIRVSEIADSKSHRYTRIKKKTKSNKKGFRGKKSKVQKNKNNTIQNVIYQQCVDSFIAAIKQKFFKNYSQCKLTFEQKVKQYISQYSVPLIETQQQGLKLVKYTIGESFANLIEINLHQALFEEQQQFKKILQNKFIPKHLSPLTILESRIQEHQQFSQKISQVVSTIKKNVYIRKLLKSYLQFFIQKQDIIQTKKQNVHVEGQVKTMKSKQLKTFSEQKLQYYIKKSQYKFIDYGFSNINGFTLKNEQGRVIYINMMPLKTKYEDNWQEKGDLAQSYVFVVYLHELAHYLCRELKLIKQEQNSVKKRWYRDNNKNQLEGGTQFEIYMFGRRVGAIIGQDFQNIQYKINAKTIYQNSFLQNRNHKDFKMYLKNYDDQIKEQFNKIGRRHENSLQGSSTNFIQLHRSVDQQPNSLTLKWPRCTSTPNWWSLRYS